MRQRPDEAVAQLQKATEAIPANASSHSLLISLRNLIAATIPKIPVTGTVATEIPTGWTPVCRACRRPVVPCGDG
jgi:hypothetical protein